MSRATRITLIAVGAFVFLGISLLLARGLTGAGQERAQVLEVLRAQAGGNADAVLAQLPACARVAACADVARARVRRLARPGEVEVLNYEPAARLALTRQLGTGRVAWRAGGSLPVVQCVRVRREGPLTGGDVELLALSNPIGREASCS